MNLKGKMLSDISCLEDVVNYEIFEDGSIFSHKNKIKKLKTSISRKGYEVIRLSCNNIKKNFPIHRLVALAFISNPNNLPQVNHIDGNKLNNHVENLEWCDNSYNQKHAFKLGLSKPQLKDEHYNYDKEHHTCKKVVQLSKDNEFISVYFSLAQASRAVGLKTYTHIRDVCIGTANLSGGFKWMFYDDYISKGGIVN